MLSLRLIRSLTGISMRLLHLESDRFFLYWRGGWVLSSGCEAVVLVGSGFNFVSLAGFFLEDGVFVERLEIMTDPHI
jgi:hypothetical protein